MMKLSIAIVNWNTRDLLYHCLESVFENLDGIESEVIVVDNGSTDGSADVVRDVFPQVKLIETGENLGFAKANNVAYRHATGEYFLLLNSDTIVLTGALSTLVKFLDEHPDAGAVGAKLFNGDGTLQRSCSPFPTPLTELFDALYLSKIFPNTRLFGRFSMSYWDFNEVRKVDFAGGSCLLLRRNALEDIGLLDEGYFMYTEEADLCYRLKQNGWAVYFEPQAWIIHYGGQSSRLDVNRTSVQLCQSKYRFMRKHYGLASAVLYRGIVALASVVRLAAWVPKMFASPVYKDKITVQSKLISWAVSAR